MRARRSFAGLRLGPVVGHTDDTTARVWIQVADDPDRYVLRVEGAGVFPFVSTEGPAREFGTAIATARGLRPDWRYRYRVARLGRFVPGAGGSVRTMPAPTSPAPVLFCTISCSGGEEDGAWNALAAFVEDAQPSFILMTGDQVYLDEDQPDIFEEHFESDPAVRRRAMAEKYQLNWSREPVRRVMATVPTYMMWDDHDIRDGWGSLAADSPTLAQRHAKGAAMFRKSSAFFHDARDVYWHFQGCHNPLAGDYRDPSFPFLPDPALPNYIDRPPAHGDRRAMPFVFRCGRLVVLVLDSRGDRDVFRSSYPALGEEQWGFIDQVFTRLPGDVDALAVVTSTPIASVDPDGQVMKLFGGRTDDVEAFKRGDEDGVLRPRSTSDDPGQILLTLANARASRLAGRQLNLGNFKLSNIDEARDQWSHRFVRREQADLLRKAGQARLVNRTAASARGLVFLSGDIHVGCTFDISSRHPSYQAASLTSSGVSNIEDVPGSLFVGVFVDEDFTVAPGIRSTLREIVPDFNFGVVQVQPTGAGANVVTSLAHEGNAFAVGVDLVDIL
jgi:hypothetical protein